MAVLKCKMCGGDLFFEPGATVCECEFCGSRQTLPSQDNEKKLTLFGRANRLRMNSEFDKASGIYESIVSEFPEEAEAYWGLVLCKYGIEYVDDPASGEKIPTCHRSSFDSVLNDSDLEQAIENADAVARKVYREEAKQIEEIRKGIIEVSEKEEPYDIFICYKETAPDGNRTIDSVIAQDVYDELTEQGYRVFFSRITLEEKLGQEYEPYIFAALNSAKIMLAFGTDYEYFNAVWVKNEWSRYLKLAEKDKNRHLIPCYKNIDAYDMPPEFARLQAQDMGKVGAVQDLIRGIQKIIGKKSLKTPSATTVVTNQSSATTSSLLERVYLFLEDRKWQDAVTYCERILDIDPRNSEAYLGKLMAKLKVRNRKQLSDCAESFEDMEDYSKVIRFGNEALINEMSGYLIKIRERKENNQMMSIYNQAKSAMNNAKTEEAYKKAADVFTTIPGFADADSLAQQCLDKAEVCRKYAIYNTALSSMNSARTEQAYKYAAEIFATIPGFANADSLAQQCLDKAEVCRKDAIYDTALSSMNERSIPAYEDAINAFRKISGWKDADEQISICNKLIEEIKNRRETDYQKAVSTLERAKEISEYKTAISLFKSLNSYKDSYQRIEQANARIQEIEEAKAKEIQRQVDLEKKKKRNKMILFSSLTAIAAAVVIVFFTVIKPGNDYNAALSLMKEGKYTEAIEAFTALGGYKDSAEQLVNCEILELKESKVGDYVHFGSYEQDNNTSSGKEEIEWHVLAKEGNKALLISRYALDTVPYNTQYVGITWEKSSLRNWLNSTFLNQAFTSEQQKRILTTSVSADKNPDYSTNPGNATEDKVFLLSILEVNKFFSSDEARKCVPTDYAIAQGAYVSDSYKVGGQWTCCWWLRSPGLSSINAAYVNYDGSVLTRGYIVHTSGDCVRPVLWIDLNS